MFFILRENYQLLLYFETIWKGTYIGSYRFEEKEGEFNWVRIWLNGSIYVNGSESS
jgi:hypothetical protein